MPIAVDEEPVDSLATPPSTHDFWGDGLSDSWAPPATPAPLGPGGHRRPRRDPHLSDRIPRARASTVRRFFRRSSGGTPSIALPARAQRAARAAPRHLRPSAGLIVAVVLMLLGLAISAGGQAGHVTRSVLATHAVTPKSPAAIAGIGSLAADTLARLRSHPYAGATRRSPRRASAPRRVHQAALRRAGHRRAPRTRVVTVVQVRYSAPAAATSASPSTASTSSSPAPVTTPVAPSATVATGTSAGSHQPATGAQGALGPGRSPDG